MSSERPVILTPISKTPKTVRVVLPEEEDGGDSSKENEETVNIVVSAKVTTTSPSKSAAHRRRRNSLASGSHHLNLDEEVERAAEAKRRTSDAYNLANMEDEDKSNLAELVASLRRQNDELRSRLDGSGSGNDGEMRRLAEKECVELRTTVSKMDRLLSIEREERNASERKTLELLQNVKQKWHEKEENRLQKLRSDLKAANTVVQDMEVELMKTQSALDSKTEELSAVAEVKVCLKSKLEKCMSRLEATLAKYEDRCKSMEALESKYKELEASAKETAAQTEAKKRRTTVSLEENRAELEAAKSKVDKMREGRGGLERELAKARVTEEALKRERDGLLRDCRENERLREENERLQEKLLSKDRKLGELEKVMEAIEEKMSSAQQRQERGETVERLQKELSLQKVELRMAEKQAADHKERIGFLREMLREDKEHRRKLEAESGQRLERLAQMEKDLAGEAAEASRLRESNDDLRLRLQEATDEARTLRKELERMEGMEDRLGALERELTSKAKDLERVEGVERHYNLTKNVCYELEDQIKEYERIIQKLEASQEKLLESNASLKGKSESASEDLITTRGQLNELKSMVAFKDSRIKDLEEKNKESKTFYETEGGKWKARYEEASADLTGKTSASAELKDDLKDVTVERDRCREVNDHLTEQNVKLKEESASLITGIHSLKDSNVMLQQSVRELADKLARRDQEVERQAAKIKTIACNLQTKEHEHKVTMEQLKKLTQHLPEGAARFGVTPTRPKKEKPFANLLL